MYNILLSRMRIFVADSFSIFFPASFLSLFLSLSFLYIFYLLSPSYPLEKFWPQPFKKPGIGTLINYILGDSANFTRNFVPKIGHVFLE